MSNNDMTLFEGGNSLVSKELFDKFNDLTNTLAGGDGAGMRRISLRGSKFRELVGGEEMHVNKDGFMNVVIVNVAPISRMFYEGTYSAETAAAPTCWSVDTKKPHPDVENPPADRCMDCPNNVKGSGVGETRACKYQQRVAVVREDDLETVWQLQLPATSVFGDVEDKKMPMQAYAKYLRAHKTPAMAIVTQMYFDDDSDVPKLFFKPVRPLNEGEVETVMEVMNSDDAERAVTITVSQVDGVQPSPEEIAAAEEEAPKPKAKAKEKAKPKKAAKDEAGEDDEDGPIEEPTKMSRRKKSDDAPAAQADGLSSVIDAWDD